MEHQGNLDGAHSGRRTGSAQSADVPQPCHTLRWWTGVTLVHTLRALLHHQLQLAQRDIKVDVHEVPDMYQAPASVGTGFEAQA